MSRLLLLLDNIMLAGGHLRLLVVGACLGLHHLLQVRLTLVLDVLLTSTSHGWWCYRLPVLVPTGVHWSQRLGSGLDNLYRPVKLVGCDEFRIDGSKQTLHHLVSHSIVTDKSLPAVFCHVGTALVRALVGLTG